MNNRVTELLEGFSGNLGSKSITGVIAVTGKFTALQFLADSVVAAQTNATGYTNADLTDFTVIKAGTIIRGRWSSITLASGEAIGYLG